MLPGFPGVEREGQTLNSPEPSLWGTTGYWPNGRGSFPVDSGYKGPTAAAAAAVAGGDVIHAYWSWPDQRQCVVFALLRHRLVSASAAAVAAVPSHPVARCTPARRQADYTTSLQYRILLSAESGPLPSLGPTAYTTQRVLQPADSRLTILKMNASCIQCIFVLRSWLTLSQSVEWSGFNHWVSHCTIQPIDYKSYRKRLTYLLNNLLTFQFIDYIFCHTGVSTTLGPGCAI